MINTGTATPRLDLLGPILQEGFPEESYVAHKVLSPILVQKRFGAIPSFLFSNDQALQIKHSPKTSYATIVSKLGQNNYSCQEAGVEEHLSVEDYEVMGKDYAEMVISRRLVHTVLRSRDLALAQTLMGATGETTFAKTLITAANAWDTANGDPIGDVLSAKLAVAKQIGVPANAMLISYELYIKLCKSPKMQTVVRNVMGYSGAVVKTAITGEIPVEVLAQHFGLDEIIIAPGIYNTANEAVTPDNAARAFIWPNNYALVFRKSTGQQDFREVAMGRMFVYDLASTIGALAVGSIDALRAIMLEWYRKEDVSADAFRCREYVDMQVLLPVAGSLIKSV